LFGSCAWPEKDKTHKIRLLLENQNAGDRILD
jgi:hypothetical protein